MSSIPSVASFVDIFIAVLPAGGAYTLQLLYLLPKQAVIRTEKFQEDMQQNLASEAMSHSVQGGWGGWLTGNGKKLSSCQAQLGQATCLAVA